MSNLSKTYCNNFSKIIGSKSPASWKNFNKFYPKNFRDAKEKYISLCTKWAKAQTQPVFPIPVLTSETSASELFAIAAFALAIDEDDDDDD